MDIVLWNDDQGRLVALTPPVPLTAAAAQMDKSLVPQDRPTFIKDNRTLPSASLAECMMNEQGVVSLNPVKVDDPTPEQIIRDRLGMTPEDLKATLEAL